MLNIYLNELSFFLTTAETLDETASWGTININIKNIDRTWEELRSTYHMELAAKKKINFNYNQLLGRCIAVKSKLTDFMKNLGASNVNAWSNVNQMKHRFELPK